MSKKEAWEPCPRCGSARVRPDSLGTLFLMLGIPLLVLGLILVFIPFIGLPLILGGVFFAAYGLYKKHQNKNLLRCLDCQNAWDCQNKSKSV